MDLGFHLNEVWHVEVAPGQALSNQQAMAMAVDAGASAIRYDFNWRDYQPSSSAAFNPDAFTLGPRAFSRYLGLRGYGEDGAALEGVYQDLRAAARAGLHTVFNLNTIPDWAKRYPTEPYKGIGNPNPKAFVLADNRRVGEFLSDFIIYCARKPNGEGLAVLRQLQGIQVFNEVGGWTLEYNPGYGFDPEHQLPYTEYLEILDHAMALSVRAFKAVGLEGKPPPVLGPNLAGTYHPAFWRAVAAYVPVNPASATASGKLKLEGISLHPYGITVRPDIDIEKWDAEKLDHYGVNNAYQTLSTHLTFNRILQPTDDWLWMLGLIDRDPDKSKAWRLFRYADVPDPARAGKAEKKQGYTADQFYDRSPELGVERTMALLDELDLRPEAIHFTEFGASAFAGGKGNEALYDTTFADPYRYGAYLQGKPMPAAVADTLQAEAMLQSLGLFANWDFVQTATAFTMFDKGEKGYQAQFGLARHELDKSGNPKWKTAGQVMLAYMAGESLSLLSPAGGERGQGVDLHVRGRTGTLNRKPEHHESILLRAADDRLDAGAGDDIVFGGDGNDTLDGGEGYDKLYGGPGNDVLSGGPGNDRLKGDSGNDELTGGPGRDNFVFAAHSFGASGQSGDDVITDFDVTADRITLIGLKGEKADLPSLIQDTPEGAKLNWAANGSTILLRGVKAADLSGRHFHVLK